MKSKLLRVFLALVIALPMFTSVFAVNSEDLIERLDVIAKDVNDMKQEYNKILADYPDVINSLSDKTKSDALTLADNLMKDNVENTIENLKAELKSSTVADANKVLDAIEDLENKADDLIDENKDVVNDVKDGIANLTIDETKEIVEKVKDIIVSLGAETDATNTYNKVLKILDDAHKMAKDINVKLETVIKDNVSTFESALTKDLIIDLLNNIKVKNKEAVIDTLIEALNNANGGASLKSKLKEIKNDAATLKNKLMELNELDEQDLLMFTDAQKTAVSNKLKQVEKDYIDFAKVVLDNYSKDYMQVVINLAYDESVDKMIEYSNEALDFYAEYKDTIKELANKDIDLSKLDLPKGLIKKAGLMVALGFVDTTDYNKDYVEKNFKAQINDLTEYIAEELINYLDHIDKTINDEVTNTYQNGTDANKVQENLRKITYARFNTITNMKDLKSRVDTELLSNKEDIKADLGKLADYVYTMFNDNILVSMEATMLKENDKKDRNFEYNYMDAYIVTNKFMNTKDFTTVLGVPKANESIVEYTKLANNKIKTGSVLTVTLSEESIAMVTFAVLGDVYVDGLIDARDYMVIKNYIMKGENVSKIALIAADTYRDKDIDARDYMVIKNYIMKDQEISL